MNPGSDAFGGKYSLHHSNFPAPDITYSDIAAPFFVPLLLANLTCSVMDDGAGGNPSYCSVFANGYNENGGDQNGNSLCQSAEPHNHNDDIIPESLKDVVKLEEDGIHIFYRKYLKRAVEILEIEGMKIWKDADIFGLLIPMQSRFSNLIEFGLKIRGDCGFPLPTSFIGQWEWELDQQIVSNMIHFSYTYSSPRSAPFSTFIRPDRGSEKHIRSNDMFYSKNCSICAEYLILPYVGEQTFLFRLGLSDDNTTSWLTNDKLDDQLKLVNDELDDDQLTYFFFENGSTPLADHTIYRKFQRLQDLCPVELHQIGEENTYYLPFRLLWPAWTTYNEKNESRLAKCDPWENDCEYELIFSKDNYKLLVPPKQKMGSKEDIPDEDDEEPVQPDEEPSIPL